MDDEAEIAIGINKEGLQHLLRAKKIKEAEDNQDQQA